MRVTVRATLFGTVGDLDKSKPYLDVASESDVEFIKDYFGNRPAVREFDGFLVRAEDGDYSEVYGFYGSVPQVGKNVYKVTRTFTEEPKYKTGKPKAAKPRKSSRKSGSVNSGLGTMR